VRTSERPGLPVVKIGMELEVTFENHNDEVWIPLFRPVDGS
jgi:hypothetical protein